MSIVLRDGTSLPLRWAPLGKVSSNGRNALLVRGLGRLTRPSFPAGVAAAGGAICIGPPAGVTVVSLGVGGGDTSGPAFV